MGQAANLESWSLAPRVYAAAVDEDLVFLDVERDAYFCVAGAAAHLNARRRRLTIAAGGLARDLRAAGLIGPLGHTPEPVTAPERPPAPTASALRWAYASPTPADVPMALSSALHALRRYRGRSLAQLLASAPPRRGPGTQSAAVLAVADRFQTWVPYLPISGKCLLRSFMLRGLLARRGLSADWVFGVATWPFSAHCWMQCGSVVLDDTVERVARFTPILVA